MSIAGGYCVDRSHQPTRERLVHCLVNECPQTPGPDETVHLGFHPERFSALGDARPHFSNVDGCPHCASDCHGREHLKAAGGA